MIENDEGGYGLACDIWSLGITLIELAESQPPYSKDEPFQIISSIPLLPPPTLSQPELWSSKFIKFLERCLVKDPKARATSADLLTDSFLKTSYEKEMKQFIIDYLEQIENEEEEDLDLTIASPVQTHSRETKYAERVWIRHPKEGYVTGFIAKKSESQVEVVSDYDEGYHIIKPTDYFHLDPKSLESVSDLSTLDDLNEAIVFHQIKSRFLKNQIYTYVGSILVSGKQREEKRKQQ